MEPAMRILHMKPGLYRAAAEGTLEDYHAALRQMRAEGADCQVAPNGNTVLHVAVLHGSKQFVEEILEEQKAHASSSSSMLFTRNNKKETVLHCAAEKGDARIVSVLIKAIREYDEDLESGVGVIEMIQMTDDVMDMALHKAVRMGHFEVVKLLIQEDNEFLYPTNDAGETPIYLAAESHFFYCLEEMLNTCTNPTYGGPSGRNALHATILSPGSPTSSWEMLMRSFKSILLGRHVDKAGPPLFIKTGLQKLKNPPCIQLLLEKKICLCEMIDDFGWTPLHYAVKLGDNETVRKILEKKSCAAYFRAGKGDDWTTIFHIAVRHGNIKTMKYISNSFPDCWAMINCKFQNVLHEAILSRRVNMIKYILKLKDPQIENLIDQKDNDGNTPLHLLGISSRASICDRYLKRKHLVFNKRHQTPLDLANQPDFAFIHISGGIPHRSGRRSGPRADLQENQETRPKDTDNVDEEINRMLRISKTMTIVATLILTITFAAGFTVPGGYDSNSGSKQAGKPILLENGAFKYFVYSDSFAFVCSILSILIYIWMVVVASSSSRKYTTIARLYYLEGSMILYTSLGVMAAFLSGIYATIEPLVSATVDLFLGFLLPLTIALGCFYILKSLKFKIRFLP